MREVTDEDLERIAQVRGRYTARGRLYAEQGLAADLSAFLPLAAPSRRRSRRPSSTPPLRAIATDRHLTSERSLSYHG